MHLPGFDWLGVRFSIWLLVALGAAVVVVWTRWRERIEQASPISFLNFWSPVARAGAAQDVSSRSTWPWWLALLGALSSLFAASDLRPAPSGARGHSVVLLLDESALQTPKSAGALRAQAQRALAALGPADHVAVVGFDAWPRVLAPWQHEPRRAQAAVAALQPQPHATSQTLPRRNLALALQLAQALTAKQEGPQFIVIGQGGYSASVAGLSSVRWLPVDQRANNVALLSFGVERAGGKPEASEQAVVHLRNDNDTVAATNLVIEDVSDPQRPRPLWQGQSKLNPREQRSVVVSLQSELPPRYRLTLRAALSANSSHNAVPEDDTALVTAPAAAPTRVVIVGPQNRYLIEALRAMSRPVDIETRPASEANIASAWPEADLLIFNEVVPATVPKRGNLLYILGETTRGVFAPGWAAEADLVRPVVTGQAPNHPILQDVNLRNLNISSSKSLKVPNNAQVLAQAFSRPLFALHRDEDRAILVLGFSLRKSDLVWRPALPLLLDNALALLAPRPPTGAHIWLNPLELPGRPAFTSAGAQTVSPWLPRSVNAAIASLRRPARWALIAALVAATALSLATVALGKTHSLLRVIPLNLAVVALTVALFDPRSVVSRDGAAAAVVIEAAGRLDHAQLAWTRTQLAGLRSKHGKHLGAWAFGANAGQVGEASWAADGLSACLQAQAHVLGAPQDEGVVAPSPSQLTVFADSRDHSNMLERCRWPNSATMSFVGMPSRVEADTALGDLTAPAWVAPAQSFTVQLAVQSTSSAQVTLQFEPASVAPSPQAAMVVRDPVTPGVFRIGVTPGTTWLPLLVPGYPPGAQTVSARIISAVPDATMGLPRNDFALTRPVMRNRPRVLVLTSNPASVRAFIDALKAQAFEVVAKSPSANAPVEEFDLVVLSDVSRSEVRKAWLENLMHAVDRGTGLLIAGGPRAFGAGGWKDDPLARLMPVQLDVPSQRPVADLAVALVVDRSGSMGGSKIDLTREAVRATSTALRPSDLLTVIAFDSRADVIVPLQMAANRARIWGQLERLASGGGTNLMPALREAHATLLGASARRRHIILLTDGHTPTGDLSGLLEQIVAADITISTVAVGRGADVGLLRRLADAGGGRLHVTEDAAHIPRIFTNDVTQAEPPSGALTDSFRVRAHQAAQHLHGLNWKQAPKLEGLTAMRARDDATVVLEATTREAVLVTWSVGSGAVATFAADLAGPWSAALTRWRDYSRLWAAVTRTLLREDPQQTFPIVVERAVNGLVATLEPMLPDGQRSVGMTGSLRVKAKPDDVDVLVTLPLRETTPGRYQAFLPAESPTAGAMAATLEATLTPTAGDDRQDIVGKGHVAWAYPSEYRLLNMPPTPNRANDVAATLHELSPMQRQVAVAWAPWLALLATLLFLGEMSLPRATFRASKTGRGAAW